MLAPCPPVPRVLVFTDDDTCRRRGRGIVASIGRMLQGLALDRTVGVVVRRTHRAPGDNAALCEALRPICRKAGVSILAHGDASLVGPLGLDGVHLTGGGLARLARLRMPRARLLGQSRHAAPRTDDGSDHDASDHDASDHDGSDDACDYATLSPIFSPSSKPGDARPTLGLAALAPSHQTGRQRRSAAVLALGGVTDQNAKACLRSGAVGVAVVGSVLGAVDPRRALLLLLEAVS